MRHLLVLALILAIPFAGGCGRGEERAQAWAASATNTLGTLETQTDHKLTPTVEAFDSAMKELGYFKGETTLKLTEAALTYRGSGDTVVSVKLKEFPTYTNIKVRCGVMGDESLSRRILARAHREF
ncbi:MAG TPA: DUF3568 family protein [Opitutaceae bacterium]|nr:DUF3568 family protein [Opitutaceae bacterium]